MPNVSYMLDIIFSDYFPIVARDVMGPKILDGAYRRMTKVGMLQIAPGRQRNRTTSQRGLDPKRNGRCPKSCYMYGPNKGKPFYGLEGE